ncbi:hypothetical protein [Aquisphaera insulae]|uniref:hypothetical protein n=1 Tax=Aquisphaera insulae TaxID=2712864 RepID=UPI0013ECAE2A|nr:hypothetical protein [Aquisphaera insulae]
MSELRTLKPARGGPRVRGVQGRLSIDLDESLDDPLPRVEPPKFARPSRARRPSKAARPQAENRDDSRRPAPIFHPLAYRSIIAEWPIDRRERWGLRANELEDTGLSWRDAETQAFVEAWNEMRQGEIAGSSAVDPGAN